MDNGIPRKMIQWPKGSSFSARQSLKYPPFCLFSNALGLSLQVSTGWFSCEAMYSVTLLDLAVVNRTKLQSSDYKSGHFYNRTLF